MLSLVIAFDHFQWRNETFRLIQLITIYSACTQSIFNIHVPWLYHVNIICFETHISVKLKHYFHFSKVFFIKLTYSYHDDLRFEPFWIVASHRSSHEWLNVKKKRFSVICQYIRCHCMLHAVDKNSACQRFEFYCEIKRQTHRCIFFI